MLRKRNAVLGTEVRAALNAHNLTSQISTLNTQNKTLTDIDRQYNVKFKELRNTVIAHRDTSDPNRSMFSALPKGMMARLITAQVQASLRSIAMALLEACLEITKTLPQRSQVFELNRQELHEKL